MQRTVPNRCGEPGKPDKEMKVDKRQGTVCTSGLTRTVETFRYAVLKLMKKRGSEAIAAACIRIDQQPRLSPFAILASICLAVVTKCVTAALSCSWGILVTCMPPYFLIRAPICAFHEDVRRRDMPYTMFTLELSVK